MILDTMTYSMMTVAAVLSFITVLLALFPEGGQDNIDKIIDKIKGVGDK